jgi:parvulin-like peptidyl-prolyl isomerase
MKGGDIGDRPDLVAPFKAAADALKPGETTAGAVATQFGYHVIMRDDPAKAADVEAQVKRSIARQLTALDKALEAAQVTAKRIDEAMRAGKPADEAMKTAIAQYVRPQKVDMLKVLGEKPGAAGDAGTADGGAKAQAPVLPPATFDASTDAERPQTATSNTFNRGGDPIPGLSAEGDASLMGFAFSAKDADVMDAPLRTPDGFYVVQLKQHKTATREEFEKERPTFLAAMLANKRDEALALYVRKLRDQAKDDVKIEESYIQEAKGDGGASSPTDDEEEY